MFTPLYVFSRHCSNTDKMRKVLCKAFHFLYILITIQFRLSRCQVFNNCAYLYHHGALGLGGEWLPDSHHLLMRLAGGADDLHILALD